MILRRRWGDIDGRALAQTTLRTAAATVVMATVVVVTDRVLGAIGWHEAGFLITAVRVLLLTGAGAASFVVAAIVLGVREIRALPGMVLRRRPAPVQNV